MARIEKQSFDAYNESDVLINTIQRYYEHAGHYSVGGYGQEFAVECAGENFFPVGISRNNSKHILPVGQNVVFELLSEEVEYSLISGQP